MNIVTSTDSITVPLSAVQKGDIIKILTSAVLPSWVGDVCLVGQASSGAEEIMNLSKAASFPRADFGTVCTVQQQTSAKIEIQ